MSIRVRVTKNQFGHVARQLPIAANSIIGKRGQEMVEVAQRHSRVDTGEMRDGWRFETRGQVASGALVNDVSHTVWNEFGTATMSAAPMARPAAEEVFPKIIEDFERIGEMLS